MERQNPLPPTLYAVRHALTHSASIFSFFHSCLKETLVEKLSNIPAKDTEPCSFVFVQSGTVVLTNISNPELLMPRIARVRRQLRP